MSLPALNMILRINGGRTCDVCGRDVCGTLMLPDDSHVCDRCAVPVLQALIIRTGRAIGIEPGVELEIEVTT